MTPCEYVETAVARIVPSRRSTTTARPDSVPKSTPTAYLLTLRTLPAGASASPDVGHLRGHHRHELDVGIQRQACHERDGSSHVLDSHRGLDRDAAVRLEDAGPLRAGHVGRGVADVDLAAGDVVGAPVQRPRL